MSSPSSSIEILRTRAELSLWRKSLGAEKRVGFVPTMGALHQGHAELLRRARPRCDVSVLSIFVNPTQFGPNEDLAKYPRTWDADLALARECGVDAIFAPQPDEMYPEGFSTFVEETRLSQPLCGRFRPGHFRGVTTVVLKLFNLVRPELALFGLKDAQQFFVLARMARDLDLTVRVEGVPTVREHDGLALSSRNAYLSADERLRAPRLAQALREAVAQLERGGSANAAIEQALSSLSSSGFRPQYLELVRLPDFAPAARLESGVPHLLATAAHLGHTRLIDNVIIRPELLSAHDIRVQLT